MHAYSVKATLVLAQTALGLLLLWYGLNNLATIPLILGLVTLTSNLAIPCALASSSLAGHPRNTSSTHKICCQV